MRSTGSHIISSGQVHQWTLNWLVQAKLLKDHGWRCTQAVVLNIVLRAAARCISVSAACRDLSEGPSDQAVMTALEEGLPKTLSISEHRLNEALTWGLPRSLRRRKWEVAIDWHLSPYYGQPQRSRNELYYGQTKQGTTKFYAYASACIISHGHRYTVALTWVRRHESQVTAIKRLLSRMREIGLKIRRVLLDRGFFNVAVIRFLQQAELPFLMPVVFRGRRSDLPSDWPWGRRKAPKCRGSGSATPKAARAPTWASITPACVSRGRAAIVPRVGWLGWGWSTIRAASTTSGDRRPGKCGIY